MSSIYGPLGPRDFSFQSDFDYRQIEFRINQYKQSQNKTEKWYWELFREIAISHCFRELRVLLINMLEENK